MVNEEPDLSDTWGRFHENVLSEIDRNMTHHRKFYEDVSEKWRSFSNVLGGTISDYMKENVDGTENLYNLWKNYQIKMNARIQRAHDTGTARYMELLKVWEESSLKMRTMIGEGVREGRVSEEVYLAWTDLTTATTKYINEAAAECNKEYKELMVTWFEFLDKMKEGVSSINQSRGQEVMTNVREMCTAMGHEISNYITMCTKVTVNLQKGWMNMLVSTRTIFSKLFPEFNYEELYSGFFDRSAWGPYGAFVAPTKVRKLEEEVKELRTKLKDLEERMGR
ncbi:MAG: hypothetical protein AB1665_06525 [Candidatus Thermoplasmatota archaeon]